MNVNEHSSISSLKETTRDGKLRNPTAKKASEGGWERLGGAHPRRQVYQVLGLMIRSQAWFVHSSVGSLCQHCGQVAACVVTMTLSL